MLWLITKLRKTATRGIEKTSCPPRFNVQRPMYSASDLSIAPRAVRVDASNNASTSARDVRSSIGGGAAVRSNESPSRIAALQFGMFPKCVANPPIVIDLACGRHPSLSSGRRSSRRRVAPIS